MAPRNDEKNSSWQWFFTFMFGVVIAIQGYNVDQQNRANERQSIYFERLLRLENKQDNQDARCKTYDEKFIRIEAILNKDEEDDHSQIQR